MQFAAQLPPPIATDLARRADEQGRVSFYDYSQIALHHPESGYYRQGRQRIGRREGADFYTASHFREAFQSIIQEAAQSLLQSSGLEPNETGFVEIGAEPGQPLLDSSTSPFATATAVHLGQPLELAGQLVVFSNELLDAQPFHSFIYRDGRWQELTVQLDDPAEPKKLRETPRDLVPNSPHEAKIALLPQPSAEGYRIDWPTGSVELLQRIASQPWTGLFIAFDYGKTWQALVRDTPQGTARAYFRHQQNPRLLERVGQQDLTTHVCWDWLQDDLRQAGFSRIDLLSQEAFIVKNAPQLLQKSFANPSIALHGQLKELLLPTFMGQKFQALSALRQPPPRVPTL